ncbi:mucin [Cryptosporidium ubiquitum]|uniref:Mucin n=1 Tax=Cryptosporidium ubiquitum TaxID=857276 RepID=A0A1J4M9S0_9CRYT|nr:mucin [Cryptosporidium ubiquitum]OII70966.1 mucin [Cryptosporidium ubiquitum]
MRLMLNDSQFQKLGSIINDVNNSKGSDCNATSICQISDILFIESEESTINNECNCNLGNISGDDNDNNNDNDDTEELSSCEEKVLLIKAGFSACIRAFTFEGFDSQHTIARVIRILRRFLKGVSLISISCNLHKEMLQGLSVIFGMVPDFNLLRVLQAPLKNYLFWCYTQSEDDYVINNSRILLCVITWMREIASNNNSNNNTSSNGSNNNFNSNGIKYGLTLSSQELLNFLISDLNNSAEHFQQESKLSLNCSDSSILELKKRILRNLELFSILIIYSGVYLPSNYNITNLSNNFFNTGGNLENACKKEAGSPVTTLITPQIMQVLGNLRIIILEEVYRVVDEFVTIYLERDSENPEIFNGEVKIKASGKSKPNNELVMDEENNNKFDQLNKIRILTSLISDIFTVRNSSNKLKSKEYSSSFNEDGSIQLELFTKVEYILMLTYLYQEIFENLLKVSGKTGLVVYSHMIQEYLISVFSIEYVPSTYYKFQNTEISQFLLKNYHSSIIFAFGLVPETRFNDFDFQIFLSFNASLKILEYYEELLQEISSIQEFSIELANSNSNSINNPQNYTKFSTYKDIMINKSIIQKLLSLTLTYSLANSIILGLRYTRVAKEFRQREPYSSLDRLINKYHILSSKVLYNIVIKNCQLFNLNLLGMQNLINSDLQIKKIIIDLTYQISNTISEYYQDSEMNPNLAVFSNIHQIFNCLLFNLDYDLKDERIEPIFNFFSSKVYSNSFSNDNDDNKFLRSSNMNNVFLHASFCDYSKKDLLYLDYKDEDFSVQSDYKPESPSLSQPPQEEAFSLSSSSSPSSSSLQSEEPKELITTSMDTKESLKFESEKLNQDESFKKDLSDMDNIDLSMNLESSSDEDDE